MSDDTGFGIDMRALKDFASALKEIEPRLYRNLRSDLREAGEAVAELARGYASAHSTSIPPTISARIVGSLSVRVGAGNAQVPLAGLYESGNKGGGKGATFRHPVFADPDTYADQPRYPYLKKAARDAEPIVLERIALAVDEAINASIRDT